MKAGIDAEGIALARQLIHQLETSGPPPESRDDVDTASLLRRYPVLQEVAVRSVEIEGPHGSIPARHYEGPTPSGIALMWVHGGAFIAGSLDMPESNWVGMELAARGISVLAVDYTKALNGIHHPVLSNEVLAAWRAASDGSLWGTEPTTLHLGGASAGAFLAAGVALRAEVDGAPSPDSLILIYPLLHRTLPEPGVAAAAAAGTLAPEQRFTPGFVQALNDNYLGDVDPLAHPAAFPAEGALSTLPPTLVINAEADDLRASGEAFGAALAAEGVFHVVESEPGTTHGYLDLPGHPGAVATLDRMADWLTTTP